MRNLSMKGVKWWMRIKKKRLKIFWNMPKIVRFVCLRETWIILVLYPRNTLTKCFLWKSHRMSHIKRVPFVRVQSIWMLLRLAPGDLRTRPRFTGTQTAQAAYPPPRQESSQIYCDALSGNSLLLATRYWMQSITMILLLLPLFPTAYHYEHILPTLSIPFPPNSPIFHKLFKFLDFPHIKFINR